MQGALSKHVNHVGDVLPVQRWHHSSPPHLPHLPIRRNQACMRKPIVFVLALRGSKLGSQPPLNMIYRIATTLLCACVLNTTWLLRGEGDGWQAQLGCISIRGFCTNVSILVKPSRCDFYKVLHQTNCNETCHSYTALLHSPMQARQSIHCTDNICTPKSCS